ncbi:MAG: fatty acid desaturase [Pseudomonadota bacterium]
MVQETGSPSVSTEDDAELRRSLKQLSRPSDSAGLRHLAAHVGLLCVTSAAIILAPFWWLALPAMLVQGVVLVFLFAPLHEAIHYTAFASRGLSKGVAAVIGLLLLLPSRWFRCYHLAHHRHTQDPNRDPELQTRPINSRYRHWRHLSGLPYWRAQARLIVRQARGRVDDPFVPAGERRSVILQARLYLIAYAAIAVVSVLTGSWLALTLWVIPALLGQPFLRAYLMAEHGDCPFVSDFFRNTRTTFTNRFVRFLAWNMPYHSEHHAFPAVPFHRLPAAHRLLSERLAVVGSGYLAVQRDLYARYPSSWREEARSS